MEVNTWFAAGSSRAPSFVNLCWQVAWVNWRAVLGAWYCSQRKALSRSAALADFECFWYSEYLRVFAAAFVGAKICAILWFWTAHDRYPTLGDNHGASWIDACWPNCVWQDRGGKCSFLSHDTIGRVRNVYTVDHSSCISWGAGCCTRGCGRWRELFAGAMQLLMVCLLASCLLFSMVDRWPCFPCKVQIHKINPKFQTW